ncbi:MAG: 3-hydroxyacyl-CoA dehydrogenase [Clostridiaceae bacterium]|nr:3-hydroxyacyl-CoA dehydrogenase [Clostridiaceae bacterium]
MTKEIKKPALIGGGVIGTQIAYQMAFRGFDVHVYDINDEAVARSKKQVDETALLYQEDLGVSQEETDAAKARMTYYTDLAECVKDRDFVVEAIIEDVGAKKDIFSKLSELCPKETIFATNSSTFIPSQLIDAVDRPERFLAFHFMIMIWRNKQCDVMMGPSTDPEVFDAVVRFGEAMDLKVLRIKKEQPGYIINSLLIPLLDAALDLLARGVASPEDIDYTWKVGTKAAVGPCVMMDRINLKTVYYTFNSIYEKTKADKYKTIVDYVKTNFIDQNKFGMESGEGFYKYN